MKSMRSGSIGLILGITMMTVALTGTPGWAAQGTEVKVTVRDTTGKVMPGVEVVLTALDETEKPLASAPFKVKTNKKGMAIFPFLQWNAQGGGLYDVAIHHEGFFIREFNIQNRATLSASDSLGTLIQDNKGKAAPSQKVPPLKAKPGGKAQIELTILSLAAYQQPRPAAAEGSESPAPGAAATAAQPVEPEKPADPLGHAQLLAAQGKHAEAEAELKTLKQTAPSAAVDFELARVYHLQEKEAEQKAALEAVIATDPVFPKAHYELGKMAYESGRSAEAITHFEAEVKGHPDSAQAQQALASIYSEVGRPGDAILVYETMVAQDPDNTDALVSLDGLYTMQADQKKSDEVFQKIKAKNPTGADLVYYRVGVSISRRADLGEAERKVSVEAFRKAVHLNPKNEKAHRELGYALIGLGKMDEARTHFRTYLELDPAAKDAATIRQFLQGS